MTKHFVIGLATFYPSFIWLMFSTHLPLQDLHKALECIRPRVSTVQALFRNSTVYQRYGWDIPSVCILISNVVLIVSDDIFGSKYQGCLGREGRSIVVSFLKSTVVTGSEAWRHRVNRRHCSLTREPSRDCRESAIAWAKCLSNGASILWSADPAASLEPCSKAIVR